MNRPIPGSVTDRETVIATAAYAAAVSAQYRIPFSDDLFQQLYETIEEVLLFSIPLSAAQKSEVEAQEPQQLAPLNPWLDKVAG